MKNITNNIILCVLILQTSIAVFANTTKPDSISSDLRNWNNARKISLLEHQLKPIDYLEKNNDIKGLLVYHYLGTGKTFLSLGLAERYPSKDVVILVPNFLVSHWKKNIDLYGVKNKARYKIVTHNDPKYAILKDLSNSIVIIDESHRLINKLSSTDPKTSDIYSDLYLNLRNSYKMLSLTGTPIYSDTMDAAYQINLVSGKDLLPFNRLKFRRDLTLVNQNKSFIRGHLLESQMMPIFATSLGMAMMPFLPMEYALFVPYIVI